MNVLQINASARREGANSTRVANSIVARLQSENPSASLTLRDFSGDPHPALDEAALGALTQLKNWIDAIARNGVTFRYTATGPKGLLTGKKVYVALARGGRYRETEADSQAPYLKTVLGFLGMTDLHFIYAEGLNMGPESAAQGFAQAAADLAAAFAFN